MGQLIDEATIPMTGPGVLLREASGAGPSQRASFAALRALISAITASEAQALIDLSVAALVDSSPAALNTLKELATALGNDPNFAATVTASIGAKYTKPGGGIPSTDLSAAVQSLLTLAGSALQTIKTINGTSLVGTGDVTISSPKGFRAVANHYYATHGLLNFSGGITVSANVLHLLPFRHPTTETWTKIWTFVNTIGSGGTCRLGVYCPDDSGDGLSTTNATLIADAGTVSVATTGTKEITGLSVPIAANKIYWLAMLCDVSFVTLGGSISTGASAQGSDVMTRGQDTALNFNQVTQARKSQAFGSLPATLSGLTMTGASIPAIGLRL